MSLLQNMMKSVRFRLLKHLTFKKSYFQIAVVN